MGSADPVFTLGSGWHPAAPWTHCLRKGNRSGLIKKVGSGTVHHLPTVMNQNHLLDKCNA